MTTRPPRWPWLLLALAAVLAAGWWLRPRPAASPGAESGPRAPADASPGIRAANPAAAAAVPRGSTPPLLPLPLAALLVPDENHDWLEQPVWHATPRGHDVELADVPFWIDGLLQFQGANAVRDGRRFRQHVSVPVPAEHAAHSWQALHLLGGTGYDAPPGTRVAEVVWRYADGTHARSPLEYAVHLRDWWGLPYEQPPRVTDPHSRCVWRADHPEAARWGKQLRLYLVSLANPRPGRPLRALELATAGNPPTLFVLGLTLDELPPGTRGSGFEDLDGLRPGLTDVQSVLVLAAGTDQPIAGAEVKASFNEAAPAPGERGAAYESTAMSGTDGHAAVPRAAAAVAHLRLRVQAAGYAAVEQSWAARPGAPIPARLEIRLEPGLSVGGVVLGPGDVPVAGAAVQFHQLNRSAEPSPDGPRPSLRDVQATTDAEGRWTTDRVPRTALEDLHVSAGHPDYIATPRGTLSAAERRDLLEHRLVLRLSAGGVVQGIVLGPDGQPFAGAQVVLGHRYQAPARRETVSGADGRFVLTRTPVWQMPLTATAEGYSPASRVVEPKEDAEVEVTLRLQEGVNLGGFVLDPEGLPVAGVRVVHEAHHFGRDGGLEWSATTDAGGRFLWRDAPRRPVKLSFLKEEFAILRDVELETGREDHVVRLPRKRRLEGRVLDAATGEPVTRFSLLRGSGGGGRLYQYGGRQEFTADDGRFTWELEEAGHNSLQVEAEGYESRVETLPAAEQDVVRVTLRLDPLEVEEGRVVDAAGQPVPGVTVVVSSADHFGGAQLTGGRFRGSSSRGEVVVTDAEGRFRPKAPPQPVAVMAAGAQGFGETPWAEFKESATVVLQPWGRIEAVTRVDGQPSVGEEWLLTWGSYTTGHGLGMLDFQEYRAVSDGEGRFVIERAPPGRRALTQLIPMGSRSWMHANETAVDVRPGETTTIELGTLGALIRGRLDAGVAAGQSDVMLRVTLAPPRPAMPAFANQQEAQAWFARPEWRAAMRSWQAVVGPDGAFALRDVAPGRYTLNATASVPNPDDDDTHNRHEIARAEVPVEVGESAPGSPLRLDLGVLRLLPGPEPKP